jgi:hypothetical protein
MPSEASSPCSASVIASTANFDALYRPRPALDANPALEEMFTMLPWARRVGNTARVTFNSPKTLVSNSVRASASEMSSTAPNNPYPALLTSTSIRPKRSSAAATAAPDCSAGPVLGRGDVQPEDLPVPVGVHRGGDQGLHVDHPPALAHLDRERVDPAERVRRSVVLRRRSAS